MSEKKRDRMRRVLRKGERQRANGMYEYRYTLPGGGTASVYSWRLIESDRVPEGKKYGKSLRELEKEISRAPREALRRPTLSSKSICLGEYITIYIQSQAWLKMTVKANYRMYGKKLLKYIGDLPLYRITHTIILDAFNRMLEDGSALSSINTMGNFLKIVLDKAVDDEILPKNPSIKAIKEFRKSCRKMIRPERKDTLSQEEQRELLRFVREDPKSKRYVPLITFMLGTGLRVSEICGLTWDDVDFNNKTITVKKNLVYVEIDGNSKFMITSPKTSKSNRTVPMLDAVEEELRALYDEQRQKGFCNTDVDGYTKFVFTTAYNKPLRATIIRQYLMDITERHNRTEKDKVPLPHMFCHMFRHTFCTRLCEADINIKIIQTVMGHARVETTMDIYASVSKSRMRDTFSGIDDDILL